MPSEKISARNITKPIQLWAAWLVGLTTIEAIFLGAAAHFPLGEERRALVVAAIAYVPIFLVAAMVLQTRFRAELQEDSYYSKMVTNRKTNTLEIVNKFEAFVGKHESLLAEITRRIQSLPEKDSSEIEERVGTDWKNWKLALNMNHPRYEDLKAKFVDAQIPVSAAFGEKNVPTKWITAINEDMPKELALKILLTTFQFSFDGFVFWSPNRETGETEDIYVGSYGNGTYISFIPDFPKIVNDELSLSEYMFKHRTG